MMLCNYALFRQELRQSLRHLVRNPYAATSFLIKYNRRRLMLASVALLVIFMNKAFIHSHLPALPNLHSDKSRVWKRFPSPVFTHRDFSFLESFSLLLDEETRAGGRTHGRPAKSPSPGNPASNSTRRESEEASRAELPRGRATTSAWMQLGLAKGPRAARARGAAPNRTRGSSRLKRPTHSCDGFQLQHVLEVSKTVADLVAALGKALDCVTRTRST